MPYNWGLVWKVWQGRPCLYRNPWNLFSKWRNLDRIKRQEDPIELKSHLWYKESIIHFFSWKILVGATKEQLKLLLFIKISKSRSVFITIKRISYRRDNSIIFFESSHRKKGLWPRCWTRISWQVQKPSRVGLFDH